MIPKSDWVWFGFPGHFICADDCRYHMCTLVGDILISTVGAMVTRSNEDGKYEEIGAGRKFETMAFEVTGEVCSAKGCGCGMPKITGNEIDCRGYNSAGDAEKGHMAMCNKFAAKGDK